jgi:ribosome-associated translation inhibitor RaiA
MEIYFKSAHSPEFNTEVTPQVIAIATKKLTSLKKHLGKKKSIAQTYVEIGKVSEAHQNGNIWQASINLDCDGKRYHADATGERAEVALAFATRELEQELRKAKKRRESLLRQGGAVLKDFVRGFSSPGGQRTA